MRHNEPEGAEVKPHPGQSEPSVALHDKEPPQNQYGTDDLRRNGGNGNSRHFFGEDQAKDNIQNDILTLKTAMNYDMWLHIQKYAGSHTIIVADKKEISDIIIFIR